MYSRGLAAGSAVTAFFAWNNRKQAQAEANYKPPYFQVGKTINPKFEKRYKGGEDALLVSTDRRMLSVCDGVGGWGELDVDPGLFSKHLCATMGDLYDSHPEWTLKTILVEAVKKNPNVGSSTAVLAKLEP
jgi:protein phosphatase PTC7